MRETIETLLKYIPFQCSSASRKFLNSKKKTITFSFSLVSVLFSEPKIPQWERCCIRFRYVLRFSALQRAENSSIQCRHEVIRVEREFQCSSASRKFLNQVRRPDVRSVLEVSVLFSEPKIPQFLERLDRIIELLEFQCSSASRKFLNEDTEGD